MKEIKSVFRNRYNNENKYLNKAKKEATSELTCAIAMAPNPPLVTRSSTFNDTFVRKDNNSEDEDEDMHVAIPRPLNASIINNDDEVNSVDDIDRENVLAEDYLNEDEHMENVASRKKNVEENSVLVQKNSLLRTNLEQMIKPIIHNLRQKKPRNK